MSKGKTQSVIKTDDDTLYYERCAGIDVHKNLLVVCLRIGRKTESRECGTTTGEIRDMVNWLKGNGWTLSTRLCKRSHKIYESQPCPQDIVNQIV